jgi:hypothetical protein
MDQDPSLEFDHVLTEKLGWRTVGAMRRGMPNAEYRAWAVFYGRRKQRQDLEQAKARG